ncbi:MAG: ABC transporter ATP-binding protein [Chloroflexi bacterium]|nr:ABC transporter ATP-binding protein [Chloroflexota bacterium]
MNILQAIGLGKQYQMGEVAVAALRSVDFAVRQGEFVAIMGPSGSGKSTLLHLLGGLDTVSDGEIILDGRRLTHLTDDEITVVRRRQIGFIFQFFNLLPTLTAAENVALPLLIDGRSLNAYQERIDELLTLVGLADRRDHKPDQLSGGQQRLAVARPLITAPAIVLADEPTGNLDSQAGGDILRLLRRACDEKGQTIVMVTHDPRAAEFADRVVQLQDGRII